MERNLAYSVEPANHPIAKELLSFLESYDPEKMLRQLTKRNLDSSSYKIVNDESLAGGADWIGKEGTKANFNNGVKYVWLSVAHEMAHQFLQTEPAWQKLDGVAEILERNGSYTSKEYNYTFQYAVEQTMACLLQAACEDVAGLRPLQKNRWDDTFEALVVEDFAEKFWQPFLDYVKDNSKYLNIDHFILEVLKKNY